MESIDFNSHLEALALKGNLRSLPEVMHDGKMISTPKHANMINLSSNDYLGVASDSSLRDRFLSEFDSDKAYFSASSSRLLTGNFEVYSRLEQKLCEIYNKEAALIFNSGYHANMGILPAITTSKSLILSDKLVHASLIDGIRLSQAKSIRYRHNDYSQLENLLEKNYRQHDLVVIVSESIFSMDGDRTDLETLIKLKRLYPNVMLYIDEAHAVGAVGEHGLGVAEQCSAIAEIDLLVGTFGKALASVGAYVVCTEQIRNYLINKMRTLIFTTALPPINLEWSLFILNHMYEMKPQREHLQQISLRLRNRLGERSQISSSHIVPVIVGESSATVKMAKALQDGGFYILPVRPPTVPEGTSRLRISLTSAISTVDIDRLITTLKPLIII